MYLVIDQGTSSTKVFLFDDEQSIRFSSRLPHRVRRPGPGQVESDPLVILESCYLLIKEAFNFASKTGIKIKAAGIAAQRSTFLFWEKTSARPLTPAISWQDTRAAEETKELEAQAQLIQQLTGTPLSAHFGGPKFLHLTKKDPDLARQVKSGSDYFGPLSAFLSQSLTGVAGVDHSIAGRSLFMNIDQVNWDSELCTLFRISEDVLPPLMPTSAEYGIISIDHDTVPLLCVIGDQQAALLGQGGWASGDTALNFGTSGSVMLNSGSSPGKIPGLVSSVLYTANGDKKYLLEGTINTCNTLFDWLDKDMHIPVHRRNWDKLCQNTATAGVMVPGYCGIAAPYWKDRFDTVISNIELNNTDQIVRAAIESIGFFTHDIVSLIQKTIPVSLNKITASGGLSRGSLLQFIADLLNTSVRHARMRDHTALGVLQLLRYNARHDGEPEIFDQIYSPAMSSTTRTEKLDSWRSALMQAGIDPI